MTTQKIGAAEERRPKRDDGLDCEICGYRMHERSCKITCRNCGYTRDCSDP